MEVIQMTGKFVFYWSMTTLFRSGIKSLLQRHGDFDVVGEAGDGLDGIKRVRSLKPDVASD